MFEEPDPMFSKHSELQLSFEASVRDQASEVANSLSYDKSKNEVCKN